MKPEINKSLIVLAQELIQRFSPMLEDEYEQSRLNSWGTLLLLASVDLDRAAEHLVEQNKLIKTLAIAKSAIRHNMAKDLPKMQTPTCIIWGKNDTVTPPEVADEFNSLLPDSELFWIDKCGHAAMMEHPDTFNDILHAWLKKREF